MNEQLFVSLDELEKGNHTKRVAVRNFPEWDVSAKLRNDISSPDSASLIESVPSTGLGTVVPQNGYADQIFPACGLFLLGFFCLFPWIFGAIYIKARNTTARTAGVLSLILAITTVLVVTIVFLTSLKS